MISYAKSKGIIDLMFNTNATSLTKSKAQKILDSGLDQLFFSFDSPDKETYEEVRVNANYHKVLRNIKFFMELRNKSGSIEPLTRVSMVRMNQQDSEWGRFYKLFSPIVDTVAELDYMNHTEENGAHNLTDNFWKNLKKEYDKPSIDSEEVGDTTDKYCCPQLWQRMFIHPDGVVTPCCLDSSRIMVMGDVNSNSIEEIWGNDKYRMLREMHSSGDIDRVSTCAKCPLANLDEPTSALDLEMIETI